MTSVLLGFYLSLKKVNPYLIVFFLLVFFTIEGAFLTANLNQI